MTSKLISFTLILILISGFVYVTNKGEKLSIQGDSLVANSRMITATPSSENILGKKGGLRTVYTNTVPSTPSTPSNPDVKKKNIPCQIYTSGINRINPEKHPITHQFLQNKGGYCGLYSFFLSMYHTFGVREITTRNGQKMPILDPQDNKDSKNLNLDLVETTLRENPELRSVGAGKYPDNILRLYALQGKKCIIKTFPDDEIGNKCQVLDKLKKSGYNCSLAMWAEAGGGHMVYVDSVAAMSPGSCKINVGNTFDQHDPKVIKTKNDIGTVDVFSFPTTKARYKTTGYEDTLYDSTTSIPEFICCK